MVTQPRAETARAGARRLLPALVATALALLAAPTAHPLSTVPAAAETAPVPSGGDAADDVAIWVHPLRPARSTVVATDKKAGLVVYSLAGHTIQFLPHGRMNNVDLRPGFRLDGREVTLVTASNRSDDTIAVYRVDVSTRRLVPVPDSAIETGIDVYGLCMYRNQRSGLTYAFVTSERGEVEQYLLEARPEGRVAGTLVRSFDVGGQAEGCVADDRYRRLYVSEENRGIWRYDAEPGAGGRRLVDSTGAGGHLRADVEGLAIARRGGGGWLVASSQGDDAFVLYERRGSNRHVDTFTVTGAGGVDEVTNTDGLDVTTRALGRRFPGGLLVVQDGRNPGGNQNFKLVRWDALGLPDPRVRRASR